MNFNCIKYTIWKRPVFRRNVITSSLSSRQIATAIVLAETLRTEIRSSKCDKQKLRWKEQRRSRRRRKGKRDFSPSKDTINRVKDNAENGRKYLQIIHLIRD